ncbi:MAG: phage holin, LLH family [Smithella sp.]
MGNNIILSAVLQSLLEFLLPIVVVAIISALVSWARFLWAKAKSWNSDATDLLEEAAKVAVIAAEQAGAAKLIDDKKVYAMDIAERWLEQHGIHLDIELISAAVEAAVYRQFNYQKPTEIGFDLKK